jgi:cyclase
MLRARIIPCLLLTASGLVKTVRFRDGKYVGDPLNAVRIFNEKQVDELMILDIEATRFGREPNFTLIEKLAGQCRMPLCYGGGVASIECVERIVGMGVEKVAISSAAIENPGLISGAAGRVGSQSVVWVIDSRKDQRTGDYRVYARNGEVETTWTPFSLARYAQEMGAGEIVINNIDRDGTAEGYDLSLARSIRSAVTVPITILGGAGSENDLKELIQQIGIAGAAAGSLFVFKGKHKAVLLQYPNQDSIRTIAGAGRNQ